MRGAVITVRQNHEDEPRLPAGFVHIRSAIKAFLQAECDLAYREGRVNVRNQIFEALKELRNPECSESRLRRRKARRLEVVL